MTDQVDIHLSGCSKTFAGVTVLDDVSLKVLNGEFVTVLGPSGCGKTTTLRVIGGFITPDDGDVHIKGKLVTKLPPYLRNIGVVFQNYALWPHMTVAENLGFGLRIRKLPREEIAKKVERALGLVRLTGLQHRYPRELSGGQQQRSLGVTMLFVTHDQEEALSMSDKVIVMSHGRIQQMDDPRTTYERPATSFVAGFLGNANFVDGEIVEIRSPDRAVARIARGGVAEVVTPAPTSVGAKVRVVIRPEWLHVARAGTTVDANTLPGVVREVIYEGASMRYGVALQRQRPRARRRGFAECPFRSRRPSGLRRWPGGRPASPASRPARRWRFRSSSSSPSSSCR
ncbi:MAG TPA: ABC transporter ATP-binding protein [Bauldia sp.]|nr:ABC transporter ATP-binding protein [Bauldia sp.]